MEADIAPGEDHSAHASHGGGHGGGGGHMMSMAFHGGTDETVLFEGWKIETEGHMIWSCFGVFCFGLLFELIKSFRGFVLRKENFRNRRSRPSRPDILVLQQQQQQQEEDGKVRVATLNSRLIDKIVNRSHITQTLLNVLQFLVGYSLMLIFMTYNVWLCLAVTLGVGCGYFLFGWPHEDSGPPVPDIANGDCCH
ncbi:hypothetical protein BV898_09886 [Hypsibius exemplaris]|uniref:Copper transport protein n=1 Tax=Hypsibius exemplaris TaxID=2072580 RepID=A0A1W0WL69_HYPEX|nr:hypothetical protein BV898_09886 [Hypsibius exemplaris]